MYVFFVSPLIRSLPKLPSVFTSCLYHEYTNLLESTIAVVVALTASVGLLPSATTILTVPNLPSDERNSNPVSKDT